MSISKAEAVVTKAYQMGGMTQEQYDSAIKGIRSKTRYGNRNTGRRRLSIVSSYVFKCIPQDLPANAISDFMGGAN